MRVCIFAGDSLEGIGGGYTFEQEIFAALKELIPNSNHRFSLFKPGLNPIQALTIPPSHPTPQPPDQARSVPRLKAISRVFPGLGTSIRRLKPVQLAYDQFKLRALKQAGIQLTLSLSPGCITTEIPYITVLWDLEHRRKPYFPEVSLGGEWEQRESNYSRLLQRAALIICGTAAGKTEIEQFYQVPGERIKVLPFPTPQFVLDAPCSDSRTLLEKYRLPENYLFYPAQFWPHKNHVGLLLAVKLLRDQYHLTFPVVFSGSDRGSQSYIRQVVQQLDLEEQVHFLGFIPQTDLIALYRNAFALTYMSFFGPDNLPPLEAMGLGCPVIASRVTGAEEQLGDAAWLFDLQSAEQEVALAIKSLHEDPSLRQSLIDRGLKRSCTWTPKDYAKGILAILDEIDVIRRCWE